MCYITIIMLYMLSVCIIKYNFVSRGNVSILLHNKYTGDSSLFQKAIFALLVTTQANNLHYTLLEV